MPPVLARLGEQIYPPLGGASRASGLPRAAANAVSGQKPGPTVSAENRKDAAPCGTRSEIPPYRPCAALRGAIGCRAAGVIPTTGMKPLCGPCGRRLRTKLEA